MTDDLMATTDSQLDPRGTWTLFLGVVSACFVLTLGLFALTRSTGHRVLLEDTPQPEVNAPDTSALPDASETIIAALLVPALERNTVPLRFTEPRAAMGCGPGSEVRVNREPLVPGAEVPVVPFVLDWDARGCRPFGPGGARFDGRVRLMVFREDWGFSAMVDPKGMRVTLEDGRIVRVRRSGASYVPE